MNSTRRDQGETRRVLGLDWPTDVTPAERRTLVAGGLGWMLDAMDVALYSLVLSRVATTLGMNSAQSGALNSLTLVASALGGLFFGVLADRIGRTRALMASILVYSFASGACGFATSVPMLGTFRFLLGLGMGGEWATAAALIAETWRPEHRGKALGLMQSSYALGEMIAVGVVALVLSQTNDWRIVFFVGVAPALFVLWVRRKVPEPELWRQRGPETRAGSGGGLRELWNDRTLRRRALIATAMNAFSMFGYWGLFTWIPTFLSKPIADGGRGLDLAKTTTFLLVLGVGKFLGYALFGFLADRFGRRRCYFLYLLVAALLVPLYAMTTERWQLLALGPFIAFFGTGFFSGFSPLAAELFPTRIRASAMGFTYNVGRGLAAAAPYLVGWIKDRASFAAGFLVLAGAYFVASLLTLLLPDAQTRRLDG